MARDYFHLVARIVEGGKYFPVSREEIERELNRSGKFSLDAEHTLDDNGEEVTVLLSLYITWRNGESGWSVALCLHKERIDGIDFEAKYLDWEGISRSGWHRHEWDAASKTCKHVKRAIEHFEDVDSKSDFLIRSFAQMNVRLDPVDHGNDILQFT